MTREFVDRIYGGQKARPDPESTPGLISYGTRTEVGSHSVALLASIIDTCRLRRASATDLLARAIHAARMGLLAPTLPAIPADLLTAEAALALG